MKNSLIILIFCTLSFQSSAQFFINNKCDSLSIPQKNSKLLAEAQAKLNSIDADTLLVYCDFGGIKNVFSELLFCCKKNGEYIIDFFRNGNLSHKIHLNKKKQAIITSFFTDKRYLTIDTIANIIYYIDDGGNPSHFITYHIDDICRTFHYGGNNSSSQLEKLNNELWSVLAKKKTLYHSKNQE